MSTDDSDRSFATILTHLSERFSRYIDEKIRNVDHQNIISDLAGRTELSGNYLSSIILADLIALLGLLTNSVAVVIGAMLISPLMGPIFSLGLAFSIGDLRLTRRAVRNIVYSVVLTVVVAALFTLISPLKGATHEILSRTRPNIYDMLIAVFAGTAGALAMCTRKNYLFTTTGVAVATAVIPPLSVVGYGLGTWQLGVAGGGFLLFFTNLVAIVISSNIVFYILKFRGSMAEDPTYTARRRFQILGSLLVIISIPLIFTLVTDIRKVRLTGRVENILKTNLDRQKHSRLTRVSIGSEGENLIVAASVNTVKYVDSVIQNEIEKELTTQLGRPAKLDLEQVIVRSGAIDPSTVIPLRTVIPTVTPPTETLATLQAKTVARLSEGCREIESFMTPFKVSGCSITYSDKKKPIGVTITIARDYPANIQELRWLTTALEKKLAERLDLKLETVPFLPPITFTDKDEIDVKSRKLLEQLKQIMAYGPEYRLTVEVPIKNRTDVHWKRRIAHLREYLSKELTIPVSQISVKPVDEKLIRVTVTLRN